MSNLKFFLALLVASLLAGCAPANYCRLPDKIVNVGAQHGQFAGQVVDIDKPQKDYVDIAMAFFYDSHVYTGLRRCIGPRCLDLKVNDFVLFQCKVVKTITKLGTDEEVTAEGARRIDIAIKYRWHCEVLGAARPPPPK